MQTFLDIFQAISACIGIFIILCIGAELQSRMMTQEEIDSYIKFHEDFFNL